MCVYTCMSCTWGGWPIIVKTEADNISVVHVALII